MYGRMMPGPSQSCQHTGRLKSRRCECGSPLRTNPVRAATASDAVFSASIDKLAVRKGVHASRYPEQKLDRA